jgi:predicted ester cyclase
MPIFRNQDSQLFHIGITSETLVPRNHQRDPGATETHQKDIVMSYIRSKKFTGLVQLALVVTLALTLASCTQKTPIDPKATLEAVNKEVVRRYWEDLWNKKRGDVIKAIAKEPVVFHFPGGQAHQPPDLSTWFATAQIAFPDVHFTVHELFADGDYVIARWSYVATNSGVFLGQPPTGRKVTDQGINIFLVKDGKIVEMWVSQDSLGLLHQLGFIPTSTPSSANEHAGAKSREHAP